MLAARSLVLALLSLAASLGEARVTQRLDALPRGWRHVRPAVGDERVTLSVSLRPQNVASFEQLVLDISTPGHEKYGQHLEGHEVEDFLRPASAASSSVLDWLRSHGIQAMHDGGDVISFLTNSSTASSMLGTDFAWYHSEELDATKLRTLEYSLPDGLAEHVDFVEPTLKFPSIRPMKSTIHSVGSAAKVAKYRQWSAESGLSPGVAPPAAVCNDAITPACLQQLYNIHYKADAKNGNKASYASFLNEYAQNSDLTLFETEFATYAEGESFKVVKFHGGGNAQPSTNDTTEANLDNQYIVSLTYPTPVTEFSTAGCGPLIADPNEPAGACDNEPYMPFLKGIMALSNKDLPQTLSVSYGEDEQTWPEAMAKSVCNKFAQLGARGVSVMFASGDSGAGAICENNAGTVAKFVPNFPCSCPFVTSVGATQNVGPEVAASFSGGGFSNYFPRPKYQNAAVSAYLKKLGNKNAALFNASGRGIPDVSAQGVDFLVVNSGAPEPVDGTSASSPTFASVIALLNSARISSGLKPLGFLNPFLYSNGLKGLTDITTGGSSGCSNLPSYVGTWNATAGWDPVTGLGTPNFGKLLAIVAPKECNVGGPAPNPTKSVCHGTTVTANAAAAT